MRYLLVAALKSALKDCVEFYNHDYPHSAIGYVGPCTYERKQLASPVSLRVEAEAEMHNQNTIKNQACSMEYTTRCTEKM